MSQLVKHSLKFSMVLAATVGLSIAANAAQTKDLNSELDSLGTNKAVVSRAQRLDSKNKVQIVQNRLVDRNMRLEVGGFYGPVANGDSYLNTQNYGAGAEFHINPKFSLGARYIRSANSFTAEGQHAVDQAKANSGSYEVPDIDRPLETYLATVTWYMMYGKLNFFDLAVSQFDIYSLAGGGTIKLTSGNAPTYTAGLGIGFWWTQHLTSRLEARYQTYNDQVYSGSRHLDLLVATVGVGILL